MYVAIAQRIIIFSNLVVSRPVSFVGLKYKHWKSCLNYYMNMLIYIFICIYVNISSYSVLSSYFSCLFFLKVMEYIQEKDCVVAEFKNMVGYRIFFPLKKSSTSILTKSFQTLWTLCLVSVVVYYKPGLHKATLCGSRFSWKGQFIQRCGVTRLHACLFLNVELKYEKGSNVKRKGVHLCEFFIRTSDVGSRDYSLQDCCLQGGFRSLLVF